MRLNNYGFFYLFGLFFLYQQKLIILHTEYEYIIYIKHIYFCHKY